MFARLSRWQWTTVATLTVGYMGYYFCRSNFSVATPLLLDAYGEQGLTKESIGTIASIGTLLYASGKLFNGVICDFVGGRRMFLVGMVASVACTLAFSLGWGFTAFLVAWSANRLVQSMGWGALVKTALALVPPLHDGLRTRHSLPKLSIRRCPRPPFSRSAHQRRRRLAWNLRRRGGGSRRNFRRGQFHPQARPCRCRRKRARGQSP